MPVEGEDAMRRDSTNDWFTGFKKLAGTTWVEPHTTVLPEETLFEWWRDGRKLSVYVDDQDVTMFRITSIGRPLELTDPDDAAQLAAWVWLLAG